MLDAQVPNLLLQPLVENAIKHGVSKRVAGGSVRITGASDNGTLRLSVCNDGPTTLIDGPAAHTGVGLSNLRTRLRILHGEESELQLRLAQSGEAEVIVTLPLIELKMLGITLAAGVLIDATIVRGIALPAVVTLLGERGMRAPRRATRRAGLQVAPDVR